MTMTNLDETIHGQSSGYFNWRVHIISVCLNNLSKLDWCYTCCEHECKIHRINKNRETLLCKLISDPPLLLAQATLEP